MSDRPIKSFHIGRINSPRSRGFKASGYRLGMTKNNLPFNPQHPLSLTDLFNTDASEVWRKNKMKFRLTWER